MRSKELATDLKGRPERRRSPGRWRASAGRCSRPAAGWSCSAGATTIEKVRVGFGGEAEPNPELDIRLTREISRRAHRHRGARHGQEAAAHALRRSRPSTTSRRSSASSSRAIPATQRSRRSLARSEGDRRGLRPAGRQNQRSDRAQPAHRRHQGRHRHRGDSTGLGRPRASRSASTSPTASTSATCTSSGDTMVGDAAHQRERGRPRVALQEALRSETAFGDAAVGRVEPLLDDQVLRE